MSGGVISNNTAASGGGVYNYYGNFSMTEGELFNNTAASDGGGIYSFGGNFTVSGGKISYNTANKNGGGIAAPGIDGLAYVYVLEGVTFSNNRASAAYARSPAHDYLYESRVSSRVTWTSPFTQGYNNYDISYVSGPQLDKDGNPIPSPSPSPTRSPTGSPRPTGTNTPPVNPPKNGEFDWRIVAVVLAIVVILLIVVLIFYLLPKRSRPKQVKEEDLNNFTIV
jgi:predicted outer membrane repeat protein